MSDRMTVAKTAVNVGGLSLARDEPLDFVEDLIGLA